MKKPLIVITPQRMAMEQPYQGGYYYSNSFHCAAVTEAGGIPLIPPFLPEADADQLIARCDGLLMSGGADVVPSLYGQQPIAAIGKTEPDRDESDLILLRAALKYHKPILCICRGFQLTNAYLGGTLYQDLPSQRGGPLDHSREDCYGSAVHTVTPVPGTPLDELFGSGPLEVNSLHHQAVEQLAPSLRCCAEAPDGLVEAWYLPGEGQWLRGYQWHPELLEQPQQRQKIFGEFLRACGEK